jgi:hypothetical protein
MQVKHDAKKNEAGLQLRSILGDFAEDCRGFAED